MNQSQTSSESSNGLFNNAAYPQPVNLFQDSSFLRLNALPGYQRSILEDLTDKINYHINYFAIDEKSDSKLKLTCLLCCKTLHISKVEKHVQDQEHLCHLAKKCKEGSKTVSTASINVKDWEFLDFNESSQVYQCTLCNVDLLGPSNSWNKHFQSSLHCSRVETSKCNNFLNPTSSVVGNDKPKDTDLGRNYLTFMAEMDAQLKDEDKEVGQCLLHKLKDGIIYFKPTYTFNKLYFTCVACNLKLLPKKVEAHVHNQEHLKNLQKNFHSINPEATQKLSNKSKSSKVFSSPQTESSQNIFSIIAKDLNKHDKIVLESFGLDAMNILNSFELSFEGEDKLNFICKVCRLSLFPTYVRSHLHSCTKQKNLRKNHCFVNVEDLTVENRNIVKGVLNSVNYKLFFFQLFYENRSTNLGFFCNVCLIPLAPINVINHINSSSHSENLRTNQFSLEFKSLNTSNKQIVKTLTSAIKDRMNDFILVYKTGTENLRFYCKFCCLILCPENVESHIKLSNHLSLVFPEPISKQKVESKLNGAQPYTPDSQNSPLSSKVSVNPSQSSPDSHLQNLSVIKFDTLTNKQKEIMMRIVLKSNMELNCIDFLQGNSSNEIYIRCKFCGQTFNAALLPEHVKSSNHLNNLELVAAFENFPSLEESSKHILRNLYLSKLNVFALTFSAIAGARPKLKCKVCNLAVFLENVNRDWLENHLSHKNRTVSTVEGTNSNCDKQGAKNFAPFNDELVLHRNEENNSLSFASDSTSAAFSIEKPVVEHKKLKNNPSNEVELTNPFNCRDCNATINFKAETCNGLFQKGRQSIIVKCRQNSAQTVSLNKKKREVFDCITPRATPEIHDKKAKKFEPNSVQPFSAIPTLKDNPAKSNSEALSKSDKDALKMLIDNLGIGIKDLDLMLTTSSRELRLKCKFCSLVMRAENVENHLKSDAHIKYSELGSIPNLGFESLSDSNKKVVRNVLNQIGNEINDYVIDTTLRFVCKVCSASLCPSTVQNHIVSEEHLKHFCSPCNDDQVVLGEKNYQDLHRNFEQAEITKKKSYEKTQSPVLKDLSQNSHPLKSIEFSDYSDEEVEGDGDDGARKVEEISKDPGLSCDAVVEELIVKNKVSDVAASSNKIPEIGVRHVTTESNLSACSKVISKAVEDKKSQVLEKASSSSASTVDQLQSNCLTFGSADKISAESEGGIACPTGHNYSHQVTDVPEKCVSSDSEGEETDYRCPPCERLVHSTSLRSHIGSLEHNIAVERDAKGKWDVENEKEFNGKIVEMFAGDMIARKGKLFLNLVDIFYHTKDRSLWFLCRLCEVMVCGKSFQKHWSLLHLVPRNAEFEKKSSNDDKMGVKGLQIADGGFQPDESFICRLCKGQTALESVLDHSQSSEHLRFLNWVLEPINHRSFKSYKEQVVRVLCRKDSASNDLEVFHQSRSPKLYIYCIPCEKLLQPGSLNSHVETKEHFAKSIRRKWNAFANSSAEALERDLHDEQVPNPDDQERPGKKSKNGAPNETDKTSKDSCSLM